MKTPASATAILIAFSSSLSAQFRSTRNPAFGDAQRRVLMEAPSRRTADGKPDLLGNRLRADRVPLPEELGRRHRSAAKRTSGVRKIGEPGVSNYPCKFLAKWPRVISSSSLVPGVISSAVFRASQSSRR